jgi:hypothetical protein
MVNKHRHPTSPRLPVQTLPQACPPALGAFYCGMRVATAGLLGLCLPARRARSKTLRVGKVSSFYGTQADRRGVEQLGDVGVDVPDLVKNSAGTLLIPVAISPPRMDGIEPFVRWGAARLGGLAMHGVMRALIARWAALIAMLGLLALVIATSRIPCVPLWPTLQMHCR